MGSQWPHNLTKIEIVGLIHHLHLADFLEALEAVRFGVVRVEQAGPGAVQIGSIGHQQICVGRYVVRLQRMHDVIVCYVRDEVVDMGKACLRIVSEVQLLQDVVEVSVEVGPVCERNETCRCS